MEESVVSRDDHRFKELNRVARINPIDIEFQDLTYSVRDFYGTSGTRQLLKSINGKFLSGELTAIMGPSGAGKSTLLNILAGYVTTGVMGIIKVNDHPRIMKEFKKLSAYIMQEDSIQPRLTVQEAIMFAARLKLGSNIEQADREAVVLEVILLLGLENCSNTRTEYLSGGQRKRVALALELVNNPPVIFLDEPTTGLDNVAIKRCMELLHEITKLGRTVICTIHQPPSSMFKNFDQVYVLAEGYCCYNGSPSNLVPFLSDANVPCPTTYTPADYIIELVHSNIDVTKYLSQSSQNGKSNLINQTKSKPDYNKDYIAINKRSLTPLTLWEQSLILWERIFLQMSRNYAALLILIFHHILMGFLIGATFRKMGSDATQAIPMFKYTFAVNFFFTYTHMMITVLKFPLDRQLLEREFFNGWYHLKSYYITLTLSTLPSLIFLGIIFVAIVYTLVDLPMEWSRFLWFCFLMLFMGVVSEGLGYCIGSLCNITFGCIIASFLLAPLIVLAVYTIGVREVDPLSRGFMLVSYFRVGTVALNLLLFSDRNPLDCDDIYCRYAEPQNVLKDMGMQHEDLSFHFYMLLFYLVLFRLLAYMFLIFRLKTDWFKKIANYVAKIVPV